MVSIIISFLFLALFLRTCWTQYKNNPDLIKLSYFTNHLDWLRAFGLVVFVFLSISTLYFLEIDWLKWSLINLFTQSEGGGNLIVAPMWSTGSFIVSTIVYILFVLFIPYGAYIEEEIFRKDKVDVRSRIISSIKFGFFHMLVGVSILAAIVLSFVGWFFSVRYVNSLKKLDETSALISSTSLHVKYNFIIVTLLYLIITLSNFG
jgi:hypothetical protein